MNSLFHPLYYIEGRNEHHKSSPKAPAAPDPAKTAAAQGATNKETAYWNAMLNNVNQSTPYGSLTYTGGEGPYNPDKPPQFSSQINLSPEQQKIYDTQTAQSQQLLDLGGQQMNRISQSVNTPFSYSGIANAPSQEDINALSQKGQDAIMSRLDPQFGRDEEALRTRLINQGIGQGSQAYNTEFDRFNQAKNDARTQAILQGQNYGAAEQNQQLGLRNQGIQEYTTQRNAPLNEYIGLTSGTQVQNPQFQSQNYQGSQPVDYANLVNQQYQAKLGNYNSQVAGNNSTMSSLFGLGGSLAGATAGSGLAGSAGWLAMLSDERLKENIVKVAETPAGIGVYEYNFIGSDKVETGVLAQEVEKAFPHAVVTGDDGYKRVYYSEVR